MSVDILIVDDSPAVRKILQRVLVQAEVPLGKVYEANDGHEALARLKTEHIGLVLLDVKMPNMGGLELLQKIRCETAWNCIPVIMITAEGSQNTVMQALELGADGYLRKPFTADKIKEKLIGLI